MERKCSSPEVIYLVPKNASRLTLFWGTVLWYPHFFATIYALVIIFYWVNFQQHEDKISFPWNYGVLGYSYCYLWVQFCSVQIFILVYGNETCAWNQFKSQATYAVLFCWIALLYPKINSIYYDKKTHCVPPRDWRLGTGILPHGTPGAVPRLRSFLLLVPLYPNAICHRYWHARRLICLRTFWDAITLSIQIHNQLTLIVLFI